MPALNDRERGCITQALQGGRELSSTVARLYKAQGTQFQYTNMMGAILLVDNRQTSGGMFLRLADLNGGQVMWEQELYVNFRYNRAANFFHTFEGDSCVCGLSFADEGDAQKFFQVVTSQAQSLGRGGAPAGGGGSFGSRGPPPSQSAPGAPAQSSNIPPGITGSMRKKKKGWFSSSKKDDNSSRTIEISGPTDFKHEGHIGWDASNGFELRNIPPEWKKLFQAAGIKKSELKNPETAQFLVNQITQFGGAPGGAPPPPPPGGGRPPPPPPGGGRPPPPPPGGGRPPPPPPGGGGGFGGPPPPPGGGGPPPPPPPGGGGGFGGPPPPPGGGGPPPPPPPGGGGGFGGPPPPPGGGGPPPPPAAAPPPAADPPAANSFLAQIQQGVSLKTADEQAPLPDIGAMSAQDSSNLAATLARAMSARRGDMGEDNEDDDDWGDDDDWD